jgi:hypothetical protein
MKEQINSLLQKVGLRAVEVKLEQIMTGDGKAALEAEVFEAGQPVFIVNEDERIPLPVGEYEMEGDMILTVAEEGVIASFEPKAEEVEEEAPEADEQVAASEEPAATPVAKKVVESVSKETYFSAEDKANLIAELKAQIIAELSEVKEEKEEVVELAKPIQHNPEKVQPREKINFQNKEVSMKSMIYDMLSK